MLYQSFLARFFSLRFLWFFVAAILASSGSAFAGLLPGVLACVPLQAQSPDASDAASPEQRSQLAEAEKSGRFAVRQHPADALAHASLGFILSREGKYAEAASAYKKAATLNPKLPGIQLNWG